MKAAAWIRRIGKENFDFLKSDLPVKAPADTEGGVDEIVADVITKLYELGWRGPENPPAVIDPNGTKVLWPSVEGQDVAVLTSEGLAQYWKGRGHRWVLLRAEQLCRAMAGPLAARLQEMLAAYEDQCKGDGLEPIPDWADWEAFVGGENREVDAMELFHNLSN